MAQISIIIPVYNAQDYLQECLDSVLGQTMEDIEVICVDDGSTDASLQILEEYAERDHRMQVIRQQNQYAGVARNTGMKAAKGEYLLFLDSDDFFDCSLCEIAYKAAKEKDADIVLFGAKRFNEQTKAFSDAGWYLKTELLPQTDVFSRKDFNGTLLNVTFLGTWNKLFRRSFIEANQIFYQPLHNTNDVYFVAVALALAERITAIDKVLTFHRFGMNENLQSVKHKHPLCFMEAYEGVYDRMKEASVYDEVETGFVTRVLNDCVFHFRTMYGSDAKREICANIEAEHFSRMGLLELDNLRGAAWRNQRYLKTMLYAYEQEKESVLTSDAAVSDDADEDRVYPNVYDYYLACGKIMDYCMEEDNNRSESERLRRLKWQNEELQEKLERTYHEKSEINAKLQQTYKEKAERGVELKELKSHFLVRLDMKIRGLFGRKR